MRVEEVMTKAKCCGRDDTVRDAAKLMKVENIGFVPICDEGGKPIGAITDRDLAIRVLAEGRTADERLESCMTRETVSCRVGDDLDDAARLMREQRKSRVMICDEHGKLVGVISLQDLTESASDEEAGETLQEVKSDRPFAAPSH